MKVVLDDGSSVSDAELRDMRHRSRHVYLHGVRSHAAACFVPSAEAGDSVEQALEDRARLLRLVDALTGPQSC